MVCSLRKSTLWRAIPSFIVGKITGSGDGIGVEESLASRTSKRSSGGGGGGSERNGEEKCDSGC